MGEVAAMFGEVEGNVFRNPDGSTLEAIHQISNLDASGQARGKSVSQVELLLAQRQGLPAGPRAADDASCRRVAALGRRHAVCRYDPGPCISERRGQAADLRASSRPQSRIHARQHRRPPADRRREASRAAGGASAGQNASANGREESFRRHVLLAHRRHGRCRRAARCSTSCWRMRRNRSLSIRIAGVRATSSSGTIAACCTARWPTTTWRRAGACCCAWWSRVALHPDRFRREAHWIPSSNGRRARCVAVHVRLYCRSGIVRRGA